MGFKNIAILSVLLTASASVGCSVEGDSPSDSSKTVVDASGSQTGGEGSMDACMTVSVTEIHADEARALGFAVDEHLALFNHTFEVPFHRGNLDCSALPTSNDAQIRVRASLLGMDLVRREPVVPDAAQACGMSQRMYVQYRAAIDLTTDDGTLAGSFESSAASWAQPDYAGLIFVVDEDPASFTGSLGIRVDTSRAHVGNVVGQVALGATLFISRLFTSVSYSHGAEPLQDQGEGIFWPSDFEGVNGERPCGWLDVPEEQLAPISIDEFNEL